MPLLIHADVFRCSDPYSYGPPEHYMAKKYANENHVSDLVKFCKRELKSCSYWFIRLTRTNLDEEVWLTNEFISHKNALKTRIQLNADAKPESPKSITKSSTQYMPSVSLTSMIAQMEAQNAAAEHVYTTHPTP